MKVLFFAITSLCVFLFLNNKPKSTECKPFIVLSFIDDIRCSNSKIIVKLFDFPSEIVLSAEHSEKCFAVLSKAFKSGKPLLFSISTNGRLIECSEPEPNQIKAYLDDFKVIQSPFKYIRYKHNICLKKMSDTFKAIYMKFSNSKLINFEFEKGCEFRSQMVSDFLQKIKQIKPYKLFLKGDLHTSINGKKMSWCNHVVNLILLENKTGSEFKVFDPWTLNESPGLETYLNELKSNGSLISECYITEADIFTVCFSSKYALKCDSLKTQSVTFN